MCMLALLSGAFACADQHAPGVLAAGSTCGASSCSNCVRDGYAAAVVMTIEGVGLLVQLFF